MRRDLRKKVVGYRDQDKRAGRAIGCGSTWERRRLRERGVVVQLLGQVVSKLAIVEIVVARTARLKA
jgi:allantoicase